MLVYVLWTGSENLPRACEIGLTLDPGGDGANKFRKVQEQWENTGEWHAVLLRQIAAHAWDYNCYVTVWHTPPYISKVSDACPLVINKEKFANTLDAADKFLLSSNDFGRRNRCTTCDDLPANTPSERKTKLECHTSTLTCPTRLTRINDPNPNCETDIDWAELIHSDPTLAVRTLNALAYNTLFLKRLNDQFANEFSTDQKASIQRILSEYSAKLPLIANVFKLYAYQSNAPFRDRVAEALNTIVLLPAAVPGR